ncbi:uncharacterized protein FIESC28_08169 [Fusarium coffeatum]|uniref:Heterokaryon incompatibility domain-containing protein n=1 Tax=Fusarium coffeatum TaxID=231269 RepID=A0A366R8I8_9HYPO|nr:uncharacterized protein FIESC28_08169 [Fusarium coffeatum]RBR13469.1 hypothetical protein FIESC28_08169 [Fusarium coffeatum]
MPTPKSTAEAIERWIGVCDSQHSAYLGDSDSTTRNLWKTDTRVSYIALSHRWSKHTPTLSRDNYHTYLRPRSDQVLPQSYQDVIAVCRAISIRYLWVDSLCIIQDDDGTEFRTEAPLMTDIYAGAFLTLTICWDTEDRSVFHECQPRSIPRPGRVASFLDENWVANNHTLSHESDFVLVQEIEPNDFQTCVNYAATNRRAWVVQERLLSRRILYLSKDQLYWECDDCVANQASPLGIHHVQKRESIPSLICEERDRPWSLTLETYTSCDLTYEEDRLVALAGLVKAISTSTGDTFFAGIWLETWM